MAHEPGCVNMEISFENPKHEALVSDPEKLSRRFDKKGQKHSADILATLAALYAADSLSDLPRATYRPHPLDGNYKGYFSVDVTDTHRIIFRPNHKGDPSYRIDNYKSISKIEIIEIFKDYH